MQPTTSSAQSRRGPLLPPRQSDATGSQHTQNDDAPPPYDVIAHQQTAYEKATANGPSVASDGFLRSDLRTTTQDSLGVERIESDDRRRLLLVYLHGFLGDETSFRSFPAHVHNLLSVLLADSYSVYTKIYPRYYSKGSMSIARNNFSKWLEPHEGPTTDVILLGHSMGGLLASEVALMPPARNAAQQPLKHRILGTINFDVPFLGMHPRVIKSGLASMFHSDNAGDKWHDQPESSSSTDLSSQTQEVATPPPSRMDTFWGGKDPNFNPKFVNDVVLPMRKGWNNARHFVSKHSDDLFKSTKNLVASHWEFSGAMANYKELKARYARIRALEETDGAVRKSVVDAGIPARVRFINYYTASTGRPKKSKTSSLHRLASSRSASKASLSGTSLHSLDTQDRQNNGQSSSNLSQSSSRKEGWNGAMESLSIDDSRSQPLPVDSTSVPAEPRLGLSNLVPVPPLGDLSYIKDKKVRKKVADEHASAVKAYEKAVKDRDQIALARNTGGGSKQSAQKSTAILSNGKQAKREKPDSEMTHSEREELRLAKERQRMEAEGRRMRGESERQATPPDIKQSMESIPRIVESGVPTTDNAETMSTYDNSLLTPQDSSDTTSIYTTSSYASSTMSTSTTASGKPGKPKKDRKFCNLPPKDQNGERDPTWVRVFMQDVDEIGAHCGLFFVDERYERVVGDVAERIEQWVLEDAIAKGRYGQDIQGRPPAQSAPLSFSLGIMKS